MLKPKKETFYLAFTILLEAYRVFSGSLMVVFLPKDCRGHPCNVLENFTNAFHESDSIWISATAFSFLLVGVMSATYRLEVLRENKLRAYLFFNPNVSTDVLTMEHIPKYLPDLRRVSLQRLHRNYTKIVYIAFASFTINTFYSGIVICLSYLNPDDYTDERTVLAFFTSVLFLGMKLHEMYRVANAEKNIYYSAYKKTEYQFNDILPNKKRPLQDVLTLDA
jgi:hypothetical protein